MTSDSEGNDAGDEMADALYTAVGFAVLGAQRLMYAGRQVSKDARERLQGASTETRAEVSAVADAVDSRLQDLTRTPLQPVAEAAATALSAARHIREEFVDPWIESEPT